MDSWLLNYWQVGLTYISIIRFTMIMFSLNMVNYIISFISFLLKNCFFKSLSKVWDYVEYLFSVYVNPCTCKVGYWKQKANIGHNDKVKVVVIRNLHHIHSNCSTDVLFSWPSHGPITVFILTNMSFVGITGSVCADNNNRIGR